MKTSKISFVIAILISIMALKSNAHLKIVSNTLMGIGTLTPSCALDVAGYIKMNGSTLSSDMRLKENINNVTSALGNLTKLQGVTYRLKKSSLKSPSTSTLSTNPDSSIIASGVFDIYNRDHIGFLAQDVQKIYPETLFYTDKAGASINPALTPTIFSKTPNSVSSNATLGYYRPSDISKADYYK